MGQSKNVDLNLLPALRALLHERSVTRAGQRLGVGQPAMSSNLAKLRRHFDDPLLVRSGGGYQLTPFARELCEQTDVAALAVQRLFATRSEFDPTTTDRLFRISASDYVLALCGSQLTNLVTDSAPGARLHLEPLPGTLNLRVRDILRRVDALILPNVFEFPQASSRQIFEDEWVWIVSQDNRTVTNELTIEQINTLPWVLSYSWPSTTATHQLRLQGIEPPSAVVIESFLAVAFALENSDRLALLPRRLATRLCEAAAVRIVPSELSIDPLVESLWWHPMNDSDPSHEWLRQLVVSATEHLRLPCADTNAVDHWR